MKLLDDKQKVYFEQGLYAEKGKIIVCASCKTEIYKFTKNVYHGDLRKSSDVKGINGYDNPKDGDMCECPNCKVLLWL